MNRSKIFTEIIISGFMALCLALPVDAQFFIPPLDPPPVIFKPILHVVTPVPPITLSKTPEFTFSSSQEGDIIYEGDCSSSTVKAVDGDNTIKFNTLSVGEHNNCVIKVKGVLATSSPLQVPTFTVMAAMPLPLPPADLQAPNISLVSGVPTPTENTTPSVVLNTDEDGYISYQGGCLSAATEVSKGNNTITFLPLEAGTYSSCKIRVSDKSGNISSPLTIPSFTITKALATTCAGFTDILTSDPDCAAFTYVKNSGAMTGNPDGTFNPSGSLQRDQIAKIALETFGKFKVSDDYCSGVNPFPDVKNTDWAYQYVCRAKALGIATGYKSGADTGYFRPSRAVNRVEFLAIILRNLGEMMPTGDSYTDVRSTDWFAGYAKYSKNNDLFVGSVLNSSSFTTRREVAQILYKLHNLGKF